MIKSDIKIYKENLTKDELYKHEKMIHDLI